MGVAVAQVAVPPVADERAHDAGEHVLFSSGAVDRLSDGSLPRRAAGDDPCQATTSMTTVTAMTATVASHTTRMASAGTTGGLPARMASSARR